MKKAYLALGSNLGVREDFLAAALRQLRADTRNADLRASDVYETAPVGNVEQPDFLNLVAELSTNADPEALLQLCFDVEKHLGRERTVRWGPRTIDVDLLWYEGAEMSTQRLTLPHPRLAGRAFVLAPWAELAPGLRIGEKTISALAARVGLAGVRRVGPLAWEA